MRFVRLAGHEVTFAKGCAEIGALRGNFDAGFEKRNGVFKIILGHADAAEQKNDVGVFRSEFVRADEQFECVHGAGLFGIDLGEQVKDLRRIGLDGIARA